MSIRALNWCWRQRLGRATDKLVLLKLADMANDDGLCWPSRAYLESHTELSREGLRRVLRRLEAGGFLTVQRRHDGIAYQSNVYHLALDKETGDGADEGGLHNGPPPDPRSSGGPHGSPPPNHSAQGGLRPCRRVGYPVAPNPHHESSLEPSSAHGGGTPARGAAPGHRDGSDDDAGMQNPLSSDAGAAAGASRQAEDAAAVDRDGDKVIEAMLRELRAGRPIRHPAAFAGRIVARHVQPREAERWHRIAQHRHARELRAQSELESRDRRRRELQSEIDELTRDIQQRRELATRGGDPDGAHAVGIERGQQRLEAARAELAALNDADRREL